MKLDHWHSIGLGLVVLLPLTVPGKLNFSKTKNGKNQNKETSIMVHGTVSSRCTRLMRSSTFSPSVGDRIYFPKPTRTGFPTIIRSLSNKIIFKRCYGCLEMVHKSLWAKRHWQNKKDIKNRRCDQCVKKEKKEQILEKKLRHRYTPSREVPIGEGGWFD